MNAKRFIPASLAGSLTMWLAAGLWHKVIMARYYEKATHATHEGTGIIFTAYIILGFLMTYIFHLTYKEKNPVILGIKIGIISGILWVFPHELAMAGAHGKPLLYVFKNAAWHLVEQGLGGIVIGFIYKKMSN